MSEQQVDVLIIGAGPAGASAACLLQKAGLDVLIIEKQQFPRFVIGESLLPHCMDLLDEAGLLEAVQQQDYIIKHGAEFFRGDEQFAFDFSQQFTEGWRYTYQVPRDHFDQTLAQATEAKGIPIRWQHAVTAVDFAEDGSSETTIEDEAGNRSTIKARFILDGSGYGRVLPRLLDLNAPSHLPTRTALFTHVTGDIRPQGEREGNIWICMLDDEENSWMWIIPFANGKTSVGVVARPEFLAQFPQDPNERLKALIDSMPASKRRLAEVEFTFPAQQIEGYSISVKQLSGPGYALMGNATEFLDPVFSSGVTLALASANRAAKTVIRQLNGEQPDWDREYAEHLMIGVDTFRAFVNAWYDNRFPTLIFNETKPVSIQNQICSVLAGYVWDQTNPCIDRPERVIDLLCENCMASA
ncbi:NAD(P)/FAD-dependent oxidoreductase [Pseudomonadota bacterium]